MRNFPTWPRSKSLLGVLTDRRRKAMLSHSYCSILCPSALIYLVLVDTLTFPSSNGLPITLLVRAWRSPVATARQDGLQQLHSHSFTPIPLFCLPIRQDRMSCRQHFGRLRSTSVRLPALHNPLQLLDTYTVLRTSVSQLWTREILPIYSL